MEIITDISSLHVRLKREPYVVFVPTMGNLHEGHLSLIRIAKQKAGCLVVSIFVNRLQFELTEDFDRYPRTLVHDCRLLENHSVDVLFTPDEKSICSVRQEFLLELPPVANTLEGESRPGFFRGVVSLVLKLFNLVQPQVAIFGKKDYQQLQIMREIVRQLNLSVEIVEGETVRAPDGLALSSRNRYLSGEERAEAAHLYQVLSKIKQEIEVGNRNFQELQENARETLVNYGWKVDYIVLRQLGTLVPVQADDRNLIVLGAARLGTIRLIDNLEMSIEI